MTTDMKHEAFYTCDLGGEAHKDKKAVRNDVSLMNGENHRIYEDVCDKHFAQLAAAIDKAFPKNRHFKKADKNPLKEPAKKP